MLGEVVTPHEALLTLGTLKALVPWEEEIAVTKEGMQYHCPSLRKEKPQNVKAPGEAPLTAPPVVYWSHLSAPAARLSYLPPVHPCPSVLAQAASP